MSEEPTDKSDNNKHLVRNAAVVAATVLAAVGTAAAVRNSGDTVRPTAPADAGKDIKTGANSTSNNTQAGEAVDTSSTVGAPGPEAFVSTSSTTVPEATSSASEPVAGNLNLSSESKQAVEPSAPAVDPSINQGNDDKSMTTHSADGGIGVSDPNQSTQQSAGDSSATG
ncbi:MAG: hypothetical protein ACXWLH_00980 [Candidatus Saccharimonadales bacterium]